MSAAVALGATDSATKPWGEACLYLALGSKAAFLTLIIQEGEAATAEDKMASAVTVTIPTL